jgi:hypothetical protein
MLLIFQKQDTKVLDDDAVVEQKLQKHRKIILDNTFDKAKHKKITMNKAHEMQYNTKNT